MANHNSGPRKEFVVGARIKAIVDPPGCPNNISVIGKESVIVTIDQCGHHTFIGAFPFIDEKGENRCLFFQAKHLRLLRKGE